MVNIEIDHFFVEFLGTRGGILIASIPWLISTPFIIIIIIEVRLLTSGDGRCGSAVHGNHRGGVYIILAWKAEIGRGFFIGFLRFALDRSSTTP